MFFITYLRRELRRRMRQAVLIALGLALGIGLVVTVTAASSGVKKAQADVLKSLYGVGTDITVTGKPPKASTPGNGRPQKGGTQIQVGGHPAARQETTNGECRRIGADRTIDVAIATHTLPSALTYVTVCLRGPGLAQAEKSVDALLASTTFTSP